VRRRGRTGLGMAAAVLVLPVAACTQDGAEPKHSTQSTPTTRPGSSAKPTSGTGAQPSVRKPPELDGTETLAGSRGETKGNASFEFSHGNKGEALIVAVHCRGKGTMLVTVKSVDVSFPLECLAGEVSTTYNQVSVTGAERSGTVSVQAPTSVHWSMTVGRGQPVQNESPGTATAN